MGESPGINQFRKSAKVFSWNLSTSQPACYPRCQNDQKWSKMPMDTSWYNRPRPILWDSRDNTLRRNEPGWPQGPDANLPWHIPRCSHVRSQGLHGHLPRGLPERLQVFTTNLSQYWDLIQVLGTMSASFALEAADLRVPCFGDPVGAQNQLELWKCLSQLACQTLHHTKAEAAGIVRDKVHHCQLLPGEVDEVIWPMVRLPKHRKKWKRDAYIIHQESKPYYRNHIQKK